MRGFDALKTPLQAYLGYHSRYVAPVRWVTFSGVPSTLTNFPALVKASGWNDIANGFDVHFQDSAGNELAFELDWYDDSSKTGAWWVLIPTLYTGTSIKVVTGDASITSDQSNPTTVWSGYDCVYHFTDPDNIKSSVGSYVADTSYGSLDFSGITMTSNTMTGRGMRFYQTTGYGSSNAAIRLANAISGVPKTWSAYMSNVSVLSGDRNISATTGWTQFGFYFTKATYSTYAGGQTNSISAIKDYTFSYGASTQSGSVAWVRDCAVLDTSNCTANSFRWDDPKISATGYSSSASTVFVLDEIRLGSIFRSADWLLYEQRNLSQHDNYTTYSEEV